MIIAVDFDGVLCTNEFPDIGKPNYEIISLIRQLLDRGDEVILWTTRVNDRLTEAVDWCGDRGLHFTNVNGPSENNIAEYKTDPRKIFADVYIDDRDIRFANLSQPEIASIIKYDLRRLVNGKQR